MLRVHSIETFGTNDGPGIRMIVFLQGCNFRCLYCQNPDTQSVTGGKEMQTAEIIKLLEKERPYFKNKGGLTASGGEPLLQRQGLIDLFTQAKKAGFSTALDTNGSILDEATKKLSEVTDLVLLDVKHIDHAWHQKITNTLNNTVLKFAEYLNEIHKPVWLRYVLVPGYTNQSEFLEKWVKHFINYKNIEKIEILPYHTFGVHKYKELGIGYHLEGVPIPTKEIVQQAYDTFINYFPNVYTY